jgi:hypothetical protein
MSRRWPLAVLLLILIPILPLWRAIFLGQAIGPFDQIHQFAPWLGPKPTQPWNVLQADGVLQFYVWRDLVFHAWSQGQLPFWNPYSLAGTPLIANSQSAAFYPPHVLFGVFHVPTGIGITLLAWFHLAWAGLGTRTLVQKLGGSSFGGTLAGLCFSLSPFMISWAVLPSVITTVSWIPWILACIVSVYLPGESKNFRRKAAKNATGLAFGVGMMLLAGHLQFAAYGLMAAVLLTALLVFGLGPSRSERLAGWPLVPTAFSVLGLALGVMLAAAQLLPVLNYSQFSHRRGAPTAEGYVGYVKSAIQPFELQNLVSPNLLGNPQKFAVVAGNALPNSAYWPMLAKTGANFAESAVTIGPFLLGLLCLFPWRRFFKNSLPVLAIGFFALLLALGTGLNALLYFKVPGWSATGSPGRVIVLFVLACCVIGGLASDRLQIPAKAGLARFSPVLFPVLGVVICLVLGRFFPPPLDSSERSQAILQIAQEALRGEGLPLLVALILSVSALASAYHLEKPLNRAVVLGCPVVLFLLFGGLDTIPTGDPSFLVKSPVAPSDPTARIAVVNGPWGIEAVAPALMPPNTPSAMGLHDLSGYDSLIHRDTVEMLRSIDGEDPAALANGNMMFTKVTADPARLAEAGASEVWSRKEMPQLGQPVSSDMGMLRYTINGPGRASTPIGPAKIESETLSSIRLTANGPGRLVLRDRNMPGWMAKVDGRHVPLLGSTWREVDVPAGSHTIEFSYVPPGFMSGLGVSAFAWLALVVIFFISSRLTKRPVATGLTSGSIM